MEKLLAFEGIEEKFFGETFTHLEIVPKTKEEAKELEKVKDELKNVVEHIKENFDDTEIEVFRVKDFVELRDQLLYLGKHKLIIFVRKVNKEGKLQLSRVGVKTVNESYTLIPHSEIVSEIEEIIRKAGYTPKTYIKQSGVTFRSLTVMNMEVEVEGERYKIAFLINNSYNYTSAVRIHLYLFKDSHVYPLIRDVLYRRHREKEITQEDFDKSLKYAEEVIQALPYLKRIRVRTREVLREIQGIKSTYWKKTKDGKREHRTLYIGRQVVLEVIKRAGLTTDIFTLWKTISEVVFDKNTHISGLNIQTKRKIENAIFSILFKYLKQVKRLSL